LLRANSISGYKGVSVFRTSKLNPFKAKGESVDNPRQVHLGLYPTAVEAAVAVARHAATGEVPTKRKRAAERKGRGKKRHARESSGDSDYSDDKYNDSEGDGDGSSGDDHETKSDGDEGRGGNHVDDGDEKQETAAVMGEMPPQLPLQLTSQPLPQPPPPPPLCHAPGFKGMADVRAMLVDFRLAQYSEVFEEQGYDDLEYLLGLSFEELHQIGKACGMKLGHVHKFANLMGRRRDP